MAIMRSLQDFSTVKTHVDKLMNQLGLHSPGLAFSFFVVDMILALPEDEIEDAMTDTTYLMAIGKSSGHDQGIDALYIDDSLSPAVVHLFSFKYTDTFEKIDNFYPSGEIDKIYGFVSDVIQQVPSLHKSINQTLYSKVKDIWELFRNQNPSFVIHICANFYRDFEPSEQQRFARKIDQFSNFTIEYHLMPYFVNRLTSKGKQTVNARLRAIDKNLFEKSDGDIRALIVDVDARDLLRIVVDDDTVRNDVDVDDYSILQKHDILEDAFEDNVRIYLRQRSKINRNIKETALSEDAHRLFYFNNGITITCSGFNYPKRRAPIIELENLQIVNGSQTIHALFEAFVENPGQFEDMDILCRIYETRNEQLSTNIAEYTNSQNPVKSRDIRSNDYVQKKLEVELKALGYFYERKKGQHAGEAKSKRIDAEKVGQSLLAFFNKMPAEAKDQKRTIFAERYDEIFSDEITADKVLIATTLWDLIERKKLARKKEILNNSLDYEEESYILHASHYMLYVLSELSEIYDVEKKFCSFDLIAAMYDDARCMIRNAIDHEREHFANTQENYTHRAFFKGNRPKIYLTNLLNEKRKELMAQGTP